MKYRKLGKYGTKVSVIGIGGWLTYGGYVEDKNAFACLEEAEEQGINFIDVADVYEKGESEKVAGEFLNDRERSKWVLSSKVFGRMSEDPNDQGLSTKHINESIDKSLERLQTDYLDIYFAHRFDYHTPLEETIRAFNKLIDEGKIMYYGTSTWFPAEIERAYGIAEKYGLQPPAVEQPRYNLLDRWIEIELFPTIDYTGMGVTVWSPLAQGLLTGKYNDGIPEDSRHEISNELPEREFNDEVIGKLIELEEIAEEQDMSLTQLSLSWALNRPQINSLITGASKPAHVAENAKAGDIELSSDLIKQIEEIMDNEPEYHPTYSSINYRRYKNGEI